MRAAYLHIIPDENRDWGLNTGNGDFFPSIASELNAQEFKGNRERGTGNSQGVWWGI
ncbi:MAG TPA: hypothetical protein V6D50_23270 [Chroococcales cyanobacterium]